MAQKKSYQAGDLDRLVDIFQLDALPDGYGGTIGFSPTPVVLNLPAHIESESAKETDENARTTAFNRLDFVVRYREDIKATMRLTSDGTTYDILGVAHIPEPRRTWTRIHCQTRD